MSEILFVGDVEDRKLKRKIKEAATTDVDSELLLSLCLGSNNMVGESSSSSQQRQFPCKFCNKKFPSSQALGGHQNAHRRERVLSRMNKEFDMSTLGLGAHLCPYSTMANHLPFHGSPLYHGLNMQPMAHMSAMSWPRFGPGLDIQGSHNTPLSGHRYGMTNSWGVSAETPQRLTNSWGESVETPLRLNHRDVGFGFELNQATSLARDAVNRSSIARDDLGGSQGNHYAANQQFSSSGPNLSLNL